MIGDAHPVEAELLRADSERGLLAHRCAGRGAYMDLDAHAAILPDSGLPSPPHAPSVIPVPRHGNPCPLRTDHSPPSGEPPTTSAPSPNAPNLLPCLLKPVLSPEACPEPVEGGPRKPLGAGVPQRPPDLRVNGPKWPRMAQFRRNLSPSTRKPVQSTSGRPAPFRSIPVSLPAKPIPSTVILVRQHVNPRRRPVRFRR